MKAQNTNKLTKKTVFVYKNVTDKNGFSTDPSTATMKTILSSLDIYRK